MKKKIFIVLIITFVIFNINCFAIEYKRSNDNLLIPSDVFVDSSNIDNILKTPAVSSKDKIYDFLNILSDQEKHELKNKIDEFIKETKIDISIVT
ncbi:MAG: TPM domain-containing protein, partial [Bacilli bacterium]|nr:TPM domain-containing protein [Bacilli bacterium]